MLGDTARRHSTGLQYSRYKIVISVLQCPFYCDGAKACSHVVPLHQGVSLASSSVPPSDYSSMSSPYPGRSGLEHLWTFCHWTSRKERIGANGLSG